MKVISLKARSFKNLDVEVAFNGKSYVISGKNGAGKSSAIDAILLALGKLGTVKQPIQQGKQTAETTVEILLDKDYEYKNLTLKAGSILKCTRTWDEKSTKLNVYLEGIKLPSPADLLDTLLGIASIPDPSKLISLKPMEQKKFFEELMGFNTDEIIQRKKAALEKVSRTESQVNLTLSNIKTYDDVPDEPMEERSLDEVSALQKQHARETQEKAELDINIANGERGFKEVGDDIEWDTDTISKNETKIQEMKDEIERLTEVNRLALEKVNKNMEKRDKINTVLLELKGRRDNWISMDTSVMMAMITEINNHNALRKRQLTKIDLKFNLREQRNVLEQYKADVATIDQERVTALQKMNLPAGLEMTEDGILYEGLPVTEDQLSEAKRLRLWTKILMAMHPNLRLLYLKHGSAFDDESMHQLLQEAAEQDYQVLIEKVSNEDKIQFTLIENPE